MKKIKLILISTAIVLAVGTAFATRPCAACEYAQQYVYTMGAYVEAGEYGYDYACVSEPGICTYYKPSPILQPNYYAPCRLGSYNLIP